MLRAGTLNQLVTFFGPALQADDWWHGSGQRSELGRAWANIGQMTGKAFVRSGGVQADIRLSVRVRLEVVSRLRLAPGVLARCSGYSYSIEAVLPDLAGREYADLICREERDDG